MAISEQPCSTMKLLQRCYQSLCIIAFQAALLTAVVSSNCYNYCDYCSSSDGWEDSHARLSHRSTTSICCICRVTNQPRTGNVREPASWLTLIPTVHVVPSLQAHRVVFSLSSILCEHSQSFHPVNMLLCFFVHVDETTLWPVQKGSNVSMW